MLVEQRTDPPAIASYARDVGRREQGTIEPLFLGDSITEGWQYGNGARVFAATFGPTAAAFGVGGDHSRHLLWRITEGHLLDGLTPANIVVMIGANEMATDERADAAMAGIEAILATLRARYPSSRIVLLGILPEVLPGEEGVLPRIASTNGVLAVFAMLHSAIFVNLWSRFLRRGRVNWRLLGDGVHPTRAGYVVLTRAVASVFGIRAQLPRPTLRDIAREVRGMIRGLCAAHREPTPPSPADSRRR
jgi:lysophospholipase L1-like esterase